MVVVSPRAVGRAFLDDVLACTEARAGQKLRTREQIAAQDWEEPWWGLCRSLLAGTRLKPLEKFLERRQ